MSQSLESILQQATLYTDEVRYRIVHLPPNAIVTAAGVLAQLAAPFTALIVDKDEVTLILADDDYTDYALRLRESRPSPAVYRLITFDLPLDLTVIGFMARVSAVLAAASVSIMPLAAYERDHILVPESQFEDAWAALTALQR